MQDYYNYVHSFEIPSLHYSFKTPKIEVVKGGYNNIYWRLPQLCLSVFRGGCSYFTNDKVKVVIFCPKYLTRD